MLKDCWDYIAKPLCHIINLSLVTTTVPQTVLLYKSGPVNESENYQPSSTLPILSKLLERAVQEQIRDYLEERSLINKFQFGYRPNRSTQQATILLTDEIRFEAHDNKYLGNQLDRNLNLDENFERAYRKTSGRLPLLTKLRCHLTTLAAMKIFDMVIMPLLTYSSAINLKLTKTQSDKLLSLERRASRIIGKKVKSIRCIIKKKAINMVDKVLMNDDVCENFNDYFAINYHAKNTRNRNKLLKLPRVKLEFAKQSFK